MAENENVLETMPSVEMRIFLRHLAKATEAYFQREDVKERFEKWKAEKDAQKGVLVCENTN